MAQEILFGKLAGGGSVLVDESNNELVLNFDERHHRPELETQNAENVN